MHLEVLFYITALHTADTSYTTGLVYFVPELLNMYFKPNDTPNSSCDN